MYALIIIGSLLGTQVPVLYEAFETKEQCATIVMDIREERPFTAAFCTPFENIKGKTLLSFYTVEEER